ncbi:hypothetical protein VitviT2T_004751 [Vitis vinifera]|uniref:Uncharacterized protein n=1 Tax=Vitis vinifera TaxID=29760 RepID=A0ABY9BQG1_VITVI|nr:hypothetical protein VitviT2T_004751 [Vitis vinifera]
MRPPINMLGLGSKLKPKAPIFSQPTPRLASTPSPPLRGGSGRHHHVEIIVREWQPMRVAFSARLRTPAPPRSQRCGAWKPWSSDGSGPRRVPSFPPFSATWRRH